MRGADIYGDHYLVKTRICLKLARAQERRNVKREKRKEKLSRPWIGSKMWEKIKERKEAKFKLEGSRSEQLKQRWREECNAKNNEVKWSAREDKRKWLEKRAAAAEKATQNGRSKELYSITKSITGERQKQE